MGLLWSYLPRNDKKVVSAELTAQRLIKTIKKWQASPQTVNTCHFSIYYRKVKNLNSDES